MLTKVEVRTAQGDLLILPLDDKSNGLLIEEIEGLDPVKATIVSSSFAQMDGTQYQSSRRESRNIKLRLGLEPDYVTETVRDLRSRLYGYFMPKTLVDLRFYMSDGLTVDISGRVESFEAPLFTKEPAVNISLLCFNPDFYDPVPVELSGSSTPGSIPTIVSYDGTIETGILFKLNVNRTMSAFSIYHQPSDGMLRTLDFAAALIAGDVVAISTVPGFKFATRTRTGVDTSILYGISPQSNWIEFMPGANNIRVYATGVGVPYTIEYTDKYGGL